MIQIVNLTVATGIHLWLPYAHTCEMSSLSCVTCRHVGMPKLAVVKVVNPSQTQTLQLTAISGDSPDFHPSFFKSKVCVCVCVYMCVCGGGGHSPIYACK